LKQSEKVFLRTIVHPLNRMSDFPMIKKIGSKLNHLMFFQTVKNCGTL